MSLFEYSIYLCCVTMLSMLSIVLFSFKSNYKLSSFNFVKCDLAVSMLFYAVVFSVYIYYGVKYQSITIPSCYITPFYSYYAFFFLSLSVRHILHAPKVQMKRINLFTLPLMLVGILNYITYLVSNSKETNLTINAYLHYAHQPIGVWFSYIIYALCFIGIVWMFFKVVKQENAFQLSIENFFANDQLITHLHKRYRCYMMVGYVLVFTSILTDMCLSVYEFHASHVHNATPPPQVFYPAMAVLVSIVLTLFSIIIFNSQSAYNRTNEAFCHKTETTEDNILEAQQSQSNDNITKKKNTKRHTERTSIIQLSPTESKLIETRLKDWETNEKHPYLSESLTINKVANDIGISNRQLSEYLNNMLGVNFNTYINQLRIDYIKKMLTDNPKLTIAELAFSAGFTDASALAKVFKRFTGTTPSKYRTDNI